MKHCIIYNDRRLKLRNLVQIEGVKVVPASPYSDQPRIIVIPIPDGTGYILGRPENLKYGISNTHVSYVGTIWECAHILPHSGPTWNSI